MNNLNRFCICSLIVCVAILASPSSALAIPVLPSSFYGTVKLNNANLPDGTVVQAFKGDSMIAQGYTQTYQGDSVYSLDVPGDNTDTGVVDGGHEGDALSFKVGGILANETGTWHSATNVQLNLTVTSASTPQAPQATPTHNPTQTPIIVIRQASKTPTQELLVSPTAINPSFNTITPHLPTSIPEQPGQLVPVSGQATDGNKDPGIIILIIGIAVIVILAAGLIVWTRRRK